MRKFKDNNGREWSLNCDGETLRKVHDEVDIWLTDLADFSKGTDSLAAKMFSAPYLLLIDTLWSMCEAEVLQRNLTQKDFLKGLGGASLADASEALTATVADFFISREQREAFSSTMQALWEVQGAIEREAVKQLKDLTAKTSTEHLLKLAESLASTPVNRG